jgi:hypothetical protein
MRKRQKVIKYILQNLIIYLFHGQKWAVGTGADIMAKNTRFNSRYKHKIKNPKFQNIVKKRLRPVRISTTTQLLLYQEIIFDTKYSMKPKIVRNQYRPLSA